MARPWRNPLGKRASIGRSRDPFTNAASFRWDSPFGAGRGFRSEADARLDAARAAKRGRGR